jgi:uncharacterized protein YlxW (UPF0749 family)
MPNRTLCDVLEAMRKCHETYNFSYLLGLIEEAQNMGNRMEAALHDKSDLEYSRKKEKELQKEIKKLEEKKHNLQQSVDSLKAQKKNLEKK